MTRGVRPLCADRFVLRIQPLFEQLIPGIAAALYVQTQGGVLFWPIQPLIERLIPRKLAQCRVPCAHAHRRRPDSQRREGQRSSSKLERKWPNIHSSFRQRSLVSAWKRLRQSRRQLYGLVLSSRAPCERGPRFKGTKSAA